MAAVTVQSCDILGLCKWKRRDRIKAGNERIQPKGPKGRGGGGHHQPLEGSTVSL